MFALSQRCAAVSKAAPIWRLAAVRSLHATPVAFRAVKPVKTEEELKKDYRKQLKAIGKPQSVAPKRPHTAYLFFSLEVAKELGPSVSHLENNKRIGELGRIAGERWRALDQSQKQPYERRAAEAKQQYEKAYKEYLANRSAADAVIEQKRFNLRKKLNPTALIHKPVKDIDAPEAPLNPFILFTKQAYAMTPDRQRQIFGTAFADISLPESGKVLSEAYRKLPEDQKQKINNDYAQARRNYKAEREEYLRTSGKDVIAKEIDQLAKKAIKPPRIVRKKKKVIKKKKLSLRIKKPTRTAAAKLKAKKAALKKKSTATKKKPVKKPAPKKSTATKKTTTTKKTTAAKKKTTAAKKTVAKKTPKKVVAKKKVAVRKA